VKPGTRRTLAIFGLVLGALFIVAALWSVLAGDTDWWAAIIVLPALWIMYRIYSRWLQPRPDTPPPSQQDNP
jgi:hypothetical protein